MLVTCSAAQATTSPSGSQKGSRSSAGLVTLAPEMMSASRPACLEVREVRVVGLDVRARLRAAGQAGHAEGVDVDLGDAIAGADEAHVLLLGHQQRGVRHHVQQADVELADVLRAAHARRRGRPRPRHAGARTSAGRCGRRAAWVHLLGTARVPGPAWLPPPCEPGCRWYPETVRSVHRHGRGPQRRGPMLVTHARTPPSRSPRRPRADGVPLPRRRSAARPGDDP